MYDILMHIDPELDGDGGRQSWCGADAAQAQKGALSSRERRKRKRKEVRELFPIIHKLRHSCLRMYILAPACMACCMSMATWPVPQNRSECCP